MKFLFIFFKLNLVTDILMLLFIWILMYQFKIKFHCMYIIDKQYSIQISNFKK